MRFFSSSLITKPESSDPLTLYMLANPSKSLANTIVPAVVVFSIAMAIALIPVRNKDGLILLLQNVSDALMKMASFVAKLAPIGLIVPDYRRSSFATLEKYMAEGNCVSVC